MIQSFKSEQTTGKSTQQTCYGFRRPTWHAEKKTKAAASPGDLLHNCSDLNQGSHEAEEINAATTCGRPGGLAGARVYWWEKR
jgi:hypothetical protein